MIMQTLLMRTECTEDVKTELGGNPRLLLHDELGWMYIISCFIVMHTQVSILLSWTPYKRNTDLC